MKKFKCRMKGCGYEWVARVEKPKACPRCKQYLKEPKVLSIQEKRSFSKYLKREI